MWDARSSRLLGTVKVGAGPLFITWKRDGSEVACTDRSDNITVVDARTAKSVRTLKYSCQVRHRALVVHVTVMPNCMILWACT